LDFKIPVSRSMVKNVFKFGNIIDLYVENSACVIFKAPHSFDILSYRVRQEPFENAPNLGDCVKWFFHCHLVSNAVFLPVK
jgi:hypothetical protein